MKNKDKNSAKLREKSRKTPFENAENRAKKRVLLAKIYADTREVLASYELLPEV